MSVYGTETDSKWNRTESRGGQCDGRSMNESVS